MVLDLIFQNRIMELFLLITTILTLLLVVLRIAFSVNKIKAFRRRGVNLAKKNSYYKWLSSVFLQDLPM